MWAAVQGASLKPLADRFAAKVIGIDPSQRMLAVARTTRANGRVEFMLAPAKRLPLADRSTDLVFMSMVLHHLPDKGAAARECCRILRAGGRFCMRTCTRDIVYPQSCFFPGILPMLKANLPSAAEIIVLFEAAGLRNRTHQLVTQTLAADWQQFTTPPPCAPTCSWPGYRTRSSRPAWLSCGPTPDKAPLKTSPK